MDTLELVNRLQSAIHNNNKYERKELDTYIQHYEKELGKASNLVHNRSATLGGARSEVIELEEKIIHFISGIEVNFPNSYNDFVDKMNKDDVFIYFYNYDTSAPGLEEHSIYGAAVFRPERPLVVKKLDGAKRIDLHIVAVAQLLLNAERLVEDRQTLNERLRDLDKLVLTALDAEIKGAKRVYISATGRLSSIPFAAYIGPGMRHRIHDFEFVSSGPLDAFSHDPLPPRSGSAIISIPDYDRVPEGTGARWPLRSRPIYSQWKNGPGIKDEFVRINRLFHTKYTGVQASRPALLQVSAPAVLHISAHGDVACVSGDDIIAIAVGASQAGTQRGVKVVQVPGEHGVGHCKEAGAGLAEPAAMIALAGANRSTMAGYVDVEELRTLDLVGTELAVLAACGTGVVQMTDDEALASAMSDSLVQAGANSVVSTKWLVDDVASGKLVSKYYSLLAKGKDRATALRQAQLALMKDPAYSHPYYWAGFIHWGQAGPLLPGSLQVR